MFKTKNLNLKNIKMLLLFVAINLCIATTSSYNNHINILFDSNDNLSLQLNYPLQNSYYTYSPTLAYTSFPDFNQHILQNNYVNIKNRILDIGPATIEKIINEAISKEIEFCKNTYFVFYHGQRREFQLLQDLYTKLYEIFNDTKLNDFLFLRIPDKEFSKFDNINDFFAIYSPYHLFDNNPLVNKHILAVNVSLFGNSISSINKYISECTFKYFVRSSNITRVDFLDLCLDMFKIFKVKQHFRTYRSNLARLISLLSTNEPQKAGSLIQIFIPQNLVNEITYRSTPGGIPFNTTPMWMGFNPSPPKILPTKDILDNYPTTLLKVILNGNSILLNNQYFASTSELDELQFRILITNKIMLNPNSGVKIFRYTNETQNIKIYKDELEKLINKIIQNMGKRDNFVSNFVDKIKDLFKID